MDWADLKTFHNIEGYIKSNNEYFCPIYKEEFIKTSGTFTAPLSTIYYITGVGHGGRGSARVGVNYSTYGATGYIIFRRPVYLSVGNRIQVSITDDHTKAIFPDLGGEISIPRGGDAIGKDAVSDVPVDGGFGSYKNAITGPFGKSQLYPDMTFLSKVYNDNKATSAELPQDYYSLLTPKLRLVMAGDGTFDGTALSTGKYLKAGNGGAPSTTIGLDGEMGMIVIEWEDLGTIGLF